MYLLYENSPDYTYSAGTSIVDNPSISFAFSFFPLLLAFELQVAQFGGPRCPRQSTIIPSYHGETAL